MWRYCFPLASASCLQGALQLLKRRGADRAADTAERGARGPLDTTPARGATIFTSPARPERPGVSHSIFPPMKTIARAARFVAVACVVIGILTLRAGRVVWAHRREIRNAAIAAYAACRLAAEWAWERRSAILAAAAATYAAVCICRQELEAISARAAELVHAEPLQPLPALAPILAPLAALREALERYLARVYPPAVAG